jgi:hypothetical protein
LRRELEPYKGVEDRRVGFGQRAHVDDDDRPLRWFHIGDDRRPTGKSPMSFGVPEGLIDR